VKGHILGIFTPFCASVDFLGLVYPLPFICFVLDWLVLVCFGLFCFVFFFSL
jgi:hypothetical protein